MGTISPDAAGVRHAHVELRREGLSGGNRNRFGVRSEFDRVTLGADDELRLDGERAVEDQAHMASLRDGVIALREALRTEAAAWGLEALPSAGNFVLLRMPGGNGPTAAAVVAALLERGIIVRAMGSYRLDDCLRISIGTVEEMALLHEAMRTILN